MVIVKVNCHPKAPLTTYYDYANLPFVEIIAVAVKVGARSWASVSTARPSGTSPNQLRCAVPSVKINDMPKLVKPSIPSRSTGRTRVQSRR